MLRPLLDAALRAAPERRDEAIDEAVDALGEARVDLELAPDDGDSPLAIARRRGLWINVYNLLTLHSLRGRRASLLSAWHRCAFVRYRVVGEALTLDQLEHGLLRDNARPPYRVRRPLPDGHPALAWRVPLDPRIHFALNCGASSCPPVRVYGGETVEALDAQLDLAERSFLVGESRIDDRAREVATSELLDFYVGDFGGYVGLLARLERAFDRPPGWLDSYRLVFDKYDWSGSIRFATE